jgi:hypothetical protein
VYISDRLEKDVFWCGFDSLEGKTVLKIFYELKTAKPDR